MNSTLPPASERPSERSNKLLIWIDLEMTGLDTGRDQIIEIATILTDYDLNEVAEGPTMAIHHPPQVFAQMDEWNQKHHTQSGLVMRCQSSPFSTAQAEQKTIEFLRSHIDANQSPMCGNSICQDRRFLARLMPDLEQFFYYRNLDVTTVGELYRNWYAGQFSPFKKKRNHLALDDIRESIAELAHYRKTIFLPSDRSSTGD